MHQIAFRYIPHLEVQDMDLQWFVGIYWKALKKNKRGWNASKLRWWKNHTIFTRFFKQASRDLVKGSLLIWDDEHPNNPVTGRKRPLRWATVGKWRFTLRKTNKYALKIGPLPKRKGVSSNHQISGAKMLVSGRVPSGKLTWLFLEYPHFQ